MGLYSLSGFSRSSVYSAFSRWDRIVCLVSAGLRFTQGSVDGTVKSVWFQQVFGLLGVQ